MSSPHVAGQPSERRRVVICLAAGLVAAALSSVAKVWELTVLIGWDVTAGAFAWTVWRPLARADADTTKAFSTAEDDSRTAARALVIAAAAASLVGVLFGLARRSDTSTSTSLNVWLTTTSLSTVVLSWIVIQTVFALRYAHLYYTKGDHGVEFPGHESPNYRDFAYLAFTVGMTYQVADTNITGRPVRQTLLIHALISYVYGAVVVAVAINLVASFIGN